MSAFSDLRKQAKRYHRETEHETNLPKKSATHPHENAAIAAQATNTEET